MKLNLFTGTAVIAIAMALTAIGCSHNSPTGPIQSDLSAQMTGPGSFGSGETRKPSYETKLIGDVIKIDSANSVFVIGKSDQLVVVTSSTKARLLPITKEVLFDFKYLKPGLTVTVYGFTKDNGTVVAELVDVGEPKPVTEPVPSAS